MTTKPCPKCGRSNSVVKSTGGYWACDMCNYEEPTHSPTPEVRPLRADFPGDRTQKGTK